jgi:hypothetical protein
MLSKAFSCLHRMFVYTDLLFAEHCVDCNTLNCSTIEMNFSSPNKARPATGDRERTPGDCEFIGYIQRGHSKMRGLSRLLHYMHYFEPLLRYKMLAISKDNHIPW